jgi:hypothetical protein
MGDKEFEDYLNGKEPNLNPIPRDCQKKLLFDIIQQKMENSTNLIGIYSDLHIRFPKAEYYKELENLKKISVDAFEQLDYLMSVVLEEIDNDGGENPDE